MAKDVECLYCGAEIKDATTVPALDNDAGWEQLSAEHADDCEWITTRAHQVEA